MSETSIAQSVRSTPGNCLRTIWNLFRVRLKRRSQAFRWIAASEWLETRVLLANDLTVPAYSSLPDAQADIYLNFLGASIGHWLRYSNIEIPAFDRDSDPTSFSSEERDWIHNTWRGVAEDFAPFNINVTTVPPLSDPDSVPQHVSQVTFGGDGAWYGSAGGIGQLGGFSSSAAADPVLAFVFSDKFYGPASMASAASHEAGHNLGLSHQSEWEGTTKVKEYYPGPNARTVPIMGDPYGSLHSQWWYGTSQSSSSSIQNDVDVIAGNGGVGLRADDIGDVQRTAQPIPVQDDKLTATGLIGTEDDVDYWSFTAVAGRIIVTVDTGSEYGNLTPILELRDASGILLATAIGGAVDSVVQYYATIEYPDAEAGNYYAVVRSAGRAADRSEPEHSTDASHGFEIGTYTLTARSAPFVASKLALSQTVLTARSGQTQFIVSGATITGTDTINASWDRITVSATGGVPGDLLGFAASGSRTQKLAIKSQTYLKLGKETIGRVSVSSDRLDINLIESVDASQLEKLLHQLTFRSKKRSKGLRQIAVTLENTYTSATVSATLDVNVM